MNTLDAHMIRKLAIRSLRIEVGSMDYINTLLIMEDGLNDEPSLDLLSMECNSNVTDEATTVHVSPEPGPSEGHHVVDWCMFGHCGPMPLETENKCRRLKDCVTTTYRFAKLCLDQDVLELCVRNMGEICNDREDNSTRSFCKAIYRLSFYLDQAWTLRQRK